MALGAVYVVVRFHSTLMPRGPAVTTIIPDFLPPNWTFWMCFMFGYSMRSLRFNNSASAASSSCGYGLSQGTYTSPGADSHVLPSKCQ